MNIVQDEFGNYFSALLEKVQVVAPGLKEYEKRSIILPPRLGDLERAEFIEGLRTKILEIENLERRRKEGSLSRDDFCAQVKKILSETYNLAILLGTG